jgi:hypothetical protein
VILENDMSISPTMQRTVGHIVVVDDNPRRMRPDRSSPALTFTSVGFMGFSCDCFPVNNSGPIELPTRETPTMASDSDQPDVSQPDDLYSLPLEHFTVARDRLAARLADRGLTDEAASVLKLRKPTVAAWALNRASRHRPEAVKRLLASHDRLRAARTTELLQEASRERQKAVTEVEAVALAELAADHRPISAQTRDRIAGTLFAVATDPGGAHDLAAGRLVREIEPSGAGWGDIGWASSPAPEPAMRAKKAADRVRAQAEKLAKEVERAEQQVESARRALNEAKRRAKEARARAQRATAEAESADRAARKGSAS